MFLSREIDLKLCQIYTKIHTFTISFRNSRFKTDHIQHIRNQSENEDIPEEANLYLWRTSRLTFRLNVCDYFP